MAANLVYKNFGYFPISFSYPREWNSGSPREKKLLSSIIPGRPYSYNDENKYLDEYRGSHFAITTKKGGFDCTRHLEILFSGCIPLMPDIFNTPDHAMFFYPKALMGESLNSYRKYRRPISAESLAAYKTWCRKYLTSEAMAKYILNSLQVKVESAKILFYSGHFDNQPDYLSMFTVIGLSRLSTVDFSSNFEIPKYLFLDFQGDATSLYGRGFTFTRTIKPGSIRVAETPYTQRYDAIIATTLHSDFSEVKTLRDQYPNTPIAVLVGDDGPLGVKQLMSLRSMGVVPFLREGTKKR